MKEITAADVVPVVNKMNMPKLSMCFGLNCQDSKPYSANKTFDELVELFSEPDTQRGDLTLAEYLALNKGIPEQKEIRNKEKDGLYFIPVEFARAGTRKADEVISISCFVIDIDTGDIDRQQIENKLSGIKYVAYSSYSHHPEHPRWRVVIPYANEIVPSEHKDIYHYFQQLFDGNLDKRCETFNQIWYTPACPYDALEFFQLIVGDGEWFDATTVANVSRPEAWPIASAVYGIQHISTDDGERLKSALGHIPSDNYDDWIRIGLALFNSIGQQGYDLWIGWSMKSRKFNHAAATKTWNGFQSASSGRQLTIATIFHMAKQLGWIYSSETTPEYIKELNSNHFVAMDGGKTFVFIEEPEPTTGYPVLRPMSTTAFKEFYANQKIEKATDKGTSLVNKAKLWLEHPQRRTHKGIVFSPNMKAADGYYNLWRGFSYQPIQGDWSKYQEHMLNVVCNGNHDDFEYLLNWMAFSVQHPNEPAGVAVVLKGERGTGKGTFISTFAKLFGQHSLQVTNSKHLVGNFNSHLRQCVFLFADEAFFAGDKQGEAVLKGLITEKRIMIERKGVDAIEAQNYLHIMMASNSDWLVPAGGYERRFFVLDVGNQRMQDRVYFDAIRKQMDEQGGMEAMMFDLLNRDISNFDIYKVRRTAALDEQIIRSMSHEQMWWMDVLSKTYSGNGWKYQSREQMIESFSKAVSTLYDRGSATKLGMFLRKVLPESYPRKVHIKFGESGMTHGDCYELPPLDECRLFFVKKLGLQQSPWN